MINSKFKDYDLMIWHKLNFIVNKNLRFKANIKVNDLRPSFKIKV